MLIIELAFISKVEEHRGIDISDEIDGYVIERPNEISLDDLAFPSTRAILKKFISI